MTVIYDPTYVREFLEARCRLGDGLFVSWADILAEFKDWAKAEGEEHRIDSFRCHLAEVVREMGLKRATLVNGRPACIRNARGVAGLGIILPCEKPKKFFDPEQSIIDFVAERCEERHNHIIKKGDVFAAYTDYAKDRPDRMVVRDWFTRKFRRAAPYVISVGRDYVEVALKD